MDDTWRYAHVPRAFFPIGSYSAVAERVNPVGNSGKRKAFSWGGWAGSRAITGGENIGHLCYRPRTFTNKLERTNHVAHLMMKKTTGYNFNNKFLLGAVYG